ncbi:hypothetical protein DNQ45_10040 [Escherichia coli]|uniref:ATP-cone domain-containing protein n=1 Tax=Escherichia coli TaxID=562 RepID=A0A2W6PDZ8_ECOLX|nr:hypothetical protein DNQ45_10040 [Escherichia coli]
MTPHVMKRDGCKVPFKSERIKEAILRAAKAAEVDDADYCATVAAVVSEQMQGRNQVDINEIQTAVENQLMSGPYKQLARAYIEYRHDRDIEREKRGRLNQEIRGLVEQTNASLLNENANKDSKVIPTQRDLLAGIVAKHYARQHLLPRDVVQAHERGDIHYHDLDYSPFFPMFNCMLIDLKGMLTQGFKMGNAEIEPPKSISTATAVTAQIIAQVASHIYGGTTINRIDEVVVFHPLGEQHIASIAQIQLKRLYKRLEERGYEIHISDEALKLLSENGYDPVYGARPLKRAIQQQIENPLAQQILSGELVPGKVIRLEVNEDRIVAVQ